MSVAEPQKGVNSSKGKEKELKHYKCKNCQKYIQFDWSSFAEEDWKDLQNLRPSKSEPDSLLDKSYVMIENAISQESPPQAEAQLMEQLNLEDKINEIVSGHVEVEHPLCSVCTNKIIKSLTTQLEELSSEKRTYKDYINQYDGDVNPAQLVTRSRSDQRDGIDQVKIEKETRRLQEEIRRLGFERSKLQEELEQLEDESKRMSEFEQRFFEDANDFRYEIECLSHQHSAVRQKIREVSNHLELMKRTNVFDDAFHIYWEDHFGTINGLRLGRLPSVKNVDWEEINAGLGQCVLLLDVLTKRCQNFSFDGIQLEPMGSSSHIREKTREKKGGGWNTYYLCNTHKSFDKALQCLLVCIKQFSRWVYGEDNNFKLAYAIRGHEVADAKGRSWFSIRFTGTADEEWTQALKYMLTDLKYLLAWVARYNP